MTAKVQHVFLFLFNLHLILEIFLVFHSYAHRRESEEEMKTRRDQRKTSKENYRKGRKLEMAKDRL
jgi:hypothetical protein